MKIAMPIAGGRFSAHFGGAEAFAFYPVDKPNGVLGDPKFLTPPEHGRGVYPMWLKKHGATVVLAGGMGPRAADIFNAQGIDVVLGVEGEDPEVIACEYLAGSLQTTGGVCQEHGFHDCGNHH